MSRLKVLFKKRNNREKFIMITLIILLLILVVKLIIRPRKLISNNFSRDEVDCRIRLINNYEEEVKKLEREIKLAQDKRQEIERNFLSSDSLDNFILDLYSSNMRIEEYRLSDEFNQIIDGVNYRVVNLGLVINGSFEDIYSKFSFLEKNFSNIRILGMGLSYLDNKSWNSSLDINILLDDEIISESKEAYDE